MSGDSFAPNELEERLRPPTEDEVRDAINRFASDIRSHYGERLYGLYLFGSRARGDHGPHSDADIAVVLRDSDWSFWDEKMQHYDGACSRAYYAMFNVARVLLADNAGESLDRLKRHAAVLKQFSLHFARPGPFPPEAGRLLRRASDVRVLADYDVEFLDDERARQAMRS